MECHQAIPVADQEDPMRIKSHIKAGEEATTTKPRKLSEFYDYPVT